MISYLIEFAVIHLVCYLVYKSILKNENQLVFLRGFILFATLLALVLPLITLQQSAAIRIPNPAAAIYVNMLDPVIVDSAAEGSRKFAFDWAWLVWAVSGLMLLRLMVGLVRVFGFYARSRRETFQNFIIRNLSGLKSSFTFFNAIFIDKDHFEDQEQVILHERAHARLGHTYDLFLLNLVTIPFWWIPSVWGFLKEMKKIHEFQADSHALKTTNTDNYIKILVNTTLKNHGMSLANSFGDASVTDRLKFMKIMKRKISIWKLSSIGATALLITAMFACSDDFENEVKELTKETAVAATYSNEVADALHTLREKNPGQEYEVLLTKRSNEEAFGKIKSMDPNLIEHIFVNKEEEMITVIMRKDENTTNSLVEIESAEPETIEIHTKNQGEVFTVVETMPQYPGGKEALVAYIVEHMKYPEDAKENNIQGMVYVGFVVNEDGSLSDVTPVKSLYPSLDIAAVDMVMAMPDWIPGEQRGKAVKVKMVLPISFKI